MTGNRRSSVLTGLMLAFFLLGAPAVFAAVPAEINFQGTLEGPDGPVDGTFTLMFRLYDAATDGTPLWEEYQSVLVVQGIFNVILGTGTINPIYGMLEEAVSDNDNLWIEVQVFGEADAMAPRQKITSVGFALKAGGVSEGAITAPMLAADAVTTEKLADGAVTADKVAGGFIPNLDADRLDGQSAENFGSALDVDQNQEDITALQSTIADLQDRIIALEAKLQYLSVVAGTVNGLQGPHVMINGANLHVRNGAGSTFGGSNGLGNLIVGYNEARSTENDKSGSHTIVVGPNHNYSASVGIVVGFQNTLSSPGASISGGQHNIASGPYSSISGGSNNTASESNASVTGGEYNIAEASRSTISGGYFNTASAQWSSISGGSWNSADNFSASVSGGSHNTASGHTSSVSGGRYNSASGNYSSVSGGQSRSTSDDDDWAAGTLFQDN